jgi:mono/diheme cytochrome c family protein
MKRWLPSIFLLCAFGVSACSSDEVPPPPLPSDANSLPRGMQLAEGFGSCGFCHSANGKPGAALSGGRPMSDVFGDVAGPNITVARSGIGGWTEVNVRTLLRENKRPDGTYLYSYFHKGLEWMSDSDVTAIIAYLRSLPPVENEVERREIGIIGRNTTGFFTSVAAVMGYVPKISETFQVEYGEYLTNSVAGCNRCHARAGGTFSSDDFMAGGEEVSFDGETKVAPNITQSKDSGIGNWSQDDITTYLHTGKTPAGRSVDARFCPVEFYQRATDGEIQAVVAYLRTVPAIE